MNTNTKIETKETDDVDVVIPFHLTFQETGSPISEMNIHYQKNGLKEPLKSCFDDLKTKFKDGTIWWSTRFCCPFTNKVYHSSLPISILKESYDFSDISSPKLKPTQQTDDFFGEFRLEGDFVYFKTVKNARKSVAIRVLENFSVSGEQSMFQSIAEYHQQTGRTKIITNHIKQVESKEEYLVENIDDGDNVTLSMTSDESSSTDLSEKKFPDWVNQLFEIGVDSTSFVIEFQERLPADSNIQQTKPLCRSSPTLLCCKLSVYRPLNLTAESETYQSKTAGINDATSLIVEEIRKKMIQSDLSRHCEEFKTKHNKSECNEKAKMLDMLPKVSTYIFNPPLCMTYPISFSDKNIAAKPKLTMFVYEIIVTTKQGNSFFSELGIHPTTLTRIGVILGKDIFDYNKDTDLEMNENNFHTAYNSQSVDTSIPIEAEFHLPHCDIDCGNITLTNRSIVHFNENEKEKLTLLQSFNMVLNNWQSYGMSKYSVEYETIAKSKEIRLQRYESKERKCLFVPLKENRQQENICIGKNRGDKIYSDPFDWDLISDVMNRRNKSYIRPFDEVNQFVNIFGTHKSINLAQYCALCAFAVVAPKLYALLKLNYLPSWTMLELVVFYVTLFFFFLFLAIHLSPPIIETDYLKLQNRFFIQRKAAPRIYTTTWNKSTKETPTASSSFPVSTKRRVHKDGIKNKFEPPKTYSDYYYSRYGVHIRYPNQKLIQVRPIKNTKDSFHCKVYDSEDSTVIPTYIYAMPELITVLPMPRDFMYLIHHLNNFMHPLERMITLHSLERRIFELSSHSVVDYPLRDGPQIVFPQNGDIVPYNRKKLLNLLEECTTLSPCIFYQRLEHLGDTVIGFFMSMNIIGRNYDLKWDSDDLANIKSDSVKNKVFFRTALEVGLSSILGVSTCTSKWDFFYKHIDLFQTETEEKKSDRERNFSNENCVELSDKVLSDVFESILGAVYRLGESSLIVTLLEEFKLPLGGVDQEADENWFQSFGTCIEKGYPFELDVQWTSQMKQISDVLQEHKDVATLLELGTKQLFQILSTNCNIEASQEFLNGTELANSIIFCSLFDDSLSSDYQDSESDESIEDHWELEGLQRVALFRDNLFILGDSALHLCICTELFKRYPTASPGDLHLLRACVICDDVLAYIAIKAGIASCLFDAEAAEISVLKMEVEKSDTIGKEYLILKDGWFINGGINEYKRRWNDANWSSISTIDDTNMIEPNYPGIMGGRLFGHKKKLPHGLTSDLSFSFKAIVGGFVMSYGLERMWQYFLPLFKEVMMISPEESRSELSDLSPLFSTYQQGRSCHRLESYLSNQAKNTD